MGNSYILWGKVKDIKTFYGKNKFNNDFSMTTFVLEHQKGSVRTYVKCKSFKDNITEQSIQNGDLIELTNYYPRNEKSTNQHGQESWMQWIYVDEFKPINLNDQSQETNSSSTYQSFDPQQKMKAMLNQEQERLNNQPPAPNWEDVPTIDVDLEKVENEQKNNNHGW